jgi:hypothetical protein
LGTYDLFRKLSQSSLTEKEREVFQMKNDLLYNFESTPSFYSINIGGTNKGVHIIKNKDNIYNILSKPDETFSIGNLVIWNNENWLITSIFDDVQIQTKGVIQKAEQTLQLYKNHILYQIPAVVESNIRLYQMGTEDNKYIETPSGTIVVRIPNTDITRQINRGEIYNLGVDNWEIKDINDILEPGLLILKMEYSQESPITHNYVLTIINGDSLQINTTQELNILTELRDNGELISSPALLFSSSNENVATISSSGVVSPVAVGNAIMTVSMVSDSNIKDTIEIDVVSEAQNNYTYSLSSVSTPDTEIKLNQSKTYVTQKYLNGVAITQTFSFSIVGNINSYQMTVIDDNSCNIKALKSGESITLKAVDDSDNTKTIEKVISLKSLF